MSSSSKGRGGVKAAAIAGLGLGLLLPGLRKTIAHGLTAAAGDWTKVLAAEHKVVMTLVKALLETTPDQAVQRKALLFKIDWGLSKHSFGEETVIYPALRRLGPPADEKALYDDHAEIKILLATLRDTPADGDGWLDHVEALRIALETHMAEEESVIFPKLHDAIDDAQNAELTRLLNLQELRLA